MDYQSRLEISFYRQVAVINEAHQIYLVQHLENHKFYVKKILEIYQPDIYQKLKETPIKGLPKIFALHEEDGKLILIEEYICGETFEELLMHQKSINESDAADYILQLCDILSQLHNFHPAIIHRDIKPSNVMLTPYGNVVLLDLDTAKYVDSQKKEDTVLLGTKGYAAPEQYGFGSSNVQTDIYGLGILFRTLLTGDPGIQTSPSRRFHAIITKCTQLRAQDRYSDISELKLALQSVQGIQPPILPVTPKEHLSFMPPGFRSKNMLHGLLAVIGYSSIFLLGCTLAVENASNFRLWLNRIIFLLIALSIVFFNCNYRNLQANFPFCNVKNKFKKWGILIAYDFIIASIFLMVLIIIESILM